MGKRIIGHDFLELLVFLVVTPERGTVAMYQSIVQKTHRTKDALSERCIERHIERHISLMSLFPVPGQYMCLYL